MRQLARVKQRLRTIVAYALYFSGVLTLLKRRRLRERLVVLMYHRVLTDDELLRSHSTGSIVVTRDTFQRHLAFLNRHFQILSPDEFLRHLARHEPLPDAACLITFDDGWSDNYHNAYPLLRQHSVPATIFLPTSFIGTRRQFWQERMTRLLRQLYRQKSGDPSAQQTVLAGRDLGAIFRDTDEDTREGIDRLVRTFKSRPIEEIDHFCAALSQALPAHDQLLDEPGIDGFMDWNQVREMSENGVTFGSHAVSHRLLDLLETPDVESELGESRSEIERQVGAPVRLLAYPNGNFNADVVRSAVGAGYAAAFTTRPGTVSREDPPFTLARINVHEGLRHPPVLLAFMVGVFGSLS